MTCTNDAARDEAATVLNGDEFQRYIQQQQNWDPIGWVLDKLNWLFNPPHQAPKHRDDITRWQWLNFDPQVIRMIFYGCLVLITLTLIAVIFFWWRNRKKDMLAPEIITEEQRAETQATYATRASDAAARQDYRQAIHYLFLASVSQVIRDSDFHATDTMTNREIAAASDFSRFAALGPDLRKVFQIMVYTDEPFWFGNSQPQAADYHAFRANYDRFSKQVMPHAS